MEALVQPYGEALVILFRLHFGLKIFHGLVGDQAELIIFPQPACQAAAASGCGNN